MDTSITLKLNRDQALVLFEWLATAEENDQLGFHHPAEERVVWQLQGQLEKVLAEPFCPEYAELLKKARTAIAPDA